MGYDAKSEYERDLLLNRIQEMESHVEQLSRELSNAHRLATLGTMTGMIAHEFNTLLTPLVNWAQMAQKNPGDGQLVSKAVDRTLEGSQRLSTVVSAILGFLSNDDQLQSAQPAIVIKQAIECMANYPQKRGIKVEVHIPDENLRVAMYPVCYQQILINLMTNAVKSMQQTKSSNANETLHKRDHKHTSKANSETNEIVGGRTITISVIDDPNSDYTITSVSDTGCGITKSEITDIFGPLVTQPPEQAQPQPSQPSDQNADHPIHPTNVISPVMPNGVGLGLTVCQRLVAAAGGRIDITSEPSQGTTFEVLIPKTVNPDTNI